MPQAHSLSGRQSPVAFLGLLLEIRGFNVDHSVKDHLVGTLLGFVREVGNVHLKRLLAWEIGYGNL